MKTKRLILVSRETRLEALARRYNTIQQAQFYIEHLNQDFSDYLQEHDSYKDALGRVRNALESHGRVVMLDRDFVSRFVFEPQDTVYVLGQDGLVANTLKYLDRQPVAGINPDPGRFIGTLLPFHPTRKEHLELLEPETLRTRLVSKQVTLGKVKLTDGQTLYAVNDFFIGQQSHVSSRYELKFQGEAERQSSSGIIVSTGLGSTGWLKSVIAGALGISRQIAPAGTIPPAKGLEIPWDARELVFSVREPYASAVTGDSLVFGKITPESPLEIASLMPERGVIFSDGVEDDFLSFNAGMVASVAVAEKVGCLVMPQLA